MIQGIKRSEKDYRKLELDSSSSLKDFSQDRRKYFRKYLSGERIEEETTKAATIGSLVDCLLFTPNEFDNRFCMSCLHKAPTGLLESFVEALYNHTKEATNEDGQVTRAFEELAKDAYRDSGFKIKFETVISKFSGTDAELYYRELLDIRSKGLTVVTINDVENAEKIIQELKTNEITAPIVNLVNSDRYEVYKQLQIEGYEIDGLKLKSMIDLCVINHKQKEILIYDLKVTFSVENFFWDYYLYRLAFIQAYLYKKATEFQFKELLEKGYKVENLAFVVADSINYFSPLVYTTSDKDMKDAYEGFEYKNRTYKGVRDIILDLKFSKENNLWRISRKNYLAKGVINIKQNS